MFKYQCIWIIIGTRPECIKQAPVFNSLVKRSNISVQLVGTGQHQDLLNSVLSTYNLSLDLYFDSMSINQNLSQLMVKVISGFEKLVKNNKKPELIVVQGDTTSALATSLAAFQMGIKVAHNEAGLRTYDLNNPFPEEGNRKIISSIASLHFAPTIRAKKNLQKEGVLDSSIYMVGNTGIDSLFWALKHDISPRIQKISDETEQLGMKLCLITAHRRESAGKFFIEIFSGLKNFVEKNKEYRFIFPTHPNDFGRSAAVSVFGKNSNNIELIDPLEYISLVHLLNLSHIVLTDSGGIQEEAATLGRPTVICREVTERSEAVDIGIARVAGQSSEGVEKMLTWASNFVQNEEIWSHRPFGEGNSGEKIAELLSQNILSKENK